MPRLAARQTPYPWCSSKIQDDRSGLEAALDMARAAEGCDQLPIGCIIANDEGAVIAFAHNTARFDGDKTSHAELLAIRKAMQVADGADAYHWTLYSTLQPCPMCISAIVLSKVGRVVWAANDPKLKESQFLEVLPYQHARGLKVSACPFDDLAQDALKLYFNGKSS